MEAKPGSLMARLRQVRDPRRRQGRRYRLPGFARDVDLGGHLW